MLKRSLTGFFEFTSDRSKKSNRRQKACELRGIIRLHNLLAAVNDPGGNEEGCQPRSKEFTVGGACIEDSCCFFERIKDLSVVLYFKSSSIILIFCLSANEIKKALS